MERPIGFIPPLPTIQYIHSHVTALFIQTRLENYACSAGGLFNHSQVIHKTPAIHSAMGKSASKEISKEHLDILSKQTRFSPQEISTWYGLFVRDCPAGKLRKDQFRAIYECLYPESDAKLLSNNVFRAMDKDGDREIDFMEFLTALNVIIHGTPEEKLNFSFTICDKDNSGLIERDELFEVVSVS